MKKALFISLILLNSSIFADDHAGGNISRATKSGPKKTDPLFTCSFETPKEVVEFLSDPDWKKFYNLADISQQDDIRRSINNLYKGTPEEKDEAILDLMKKFQQLSYSKGKDLDDFFKDKFKKSGLTKLNDQVEKASKKLNDQRRSYYGVLAKVADCLGMKETTDSQGAKQSVIKQYILYTEGLPKMIDEKSYGDELKKHTKCLERLSDTDLKKYVDGIQDAIDAAPLMAEQEKAMQRREAVHLLGETVQKLREGKSLDTTKLKVIADYEDRLKKCVITNGSCEQSTSLSDFNSKQKKFAEKIAEFYGGAREENQKLWKDVVNYQDMPSAQQRETFAKLDPSEVLLKVKAAARNQNEKELASYLKYYMDQNNTIKFAYVEKGKDGENITKTQSVKINGAVTQSKLKKAWDAAAKSMGNPFGLTLINQVNPVLDANRGSISNKPLIEIKEQE